MTFSCLKDQLSKLLLCIVLPVTMQSHSAECAVNDDSNIVKVYSGFCSLDPDQFRGSGLLFQHRNEYFVVTSEHVVLHANEKKGQQLCHRMAHSTWGGRKLSLVQADWGYGLAVLKVVDSNTHFEHPIPNMSDLFVPWKQAPKVVTTYGYPSKSTGVFTAEGSILNFYSERAFIPLVPKMIEITGGHGEFGISGGPVFDDQGQFVGILSHQYMRYAAGQSSRVQEYTENEVVADHLFVISMTSVHSWLKSVLSLNNPKPPTFLRDPTRQLTADHGSIYSSGLKFTLQTGSQSFLRKDSGIGGSDGAGIGGSDGAGIGGSDGAGIGGSDGAGIGGSDGAGIGGSEGAGIGGKSAVIDDLVGIQIELDLENHTSEFDFFGREEWISLIKSHLVRRRSIFIPYFLKSDGSDFPKPEKISSLAQFFWSLSKVELTPVTMLQSSVDDTHQSKVIVSIKNKSQDLRALVKSLEPLIAKDQIPARQLLSQIKILCDLIDSNNWGLIDIQWLNALEKQREIAWVSLINVSFENSVSMLSTLRALTSDIKSIKL